MTAVLVTRPQPDAGTLAELLREKNFNVLVDPLFTTVFTDAPPPLRDWQALLVTSRNAVRALARQPSFKDFVRFPLFAVGEETEAEAKLAGFRDVRSASGSASSLAALVKESCKPSNGMLLYIAGQPRKPDLEAELAGQGFGLEIWEGYVMRPSAALRDETLVALREKGIGAVLLFSERASGRYLQLAQNLGMEILKSPIYYCLSEQVAVPLRSHGLDAVAAPVPRLHALIELLTAKNH